MSYLEDVFVDKIELPEGGHADVLSIPQEVGSFGEKRAPNPNYMSGLSRTHRPPHYQTSESRVDKLGRHRCLINGHWVPCSSMDARGLSGIASLKKIKGLRNKYVRR